MTMIKSRSERSKPFGGADRRDAGGGRRLLVLSTEFPPGPGGIGTHAWQVASHAAAVGWDVTVLTNQEYVTLREAELFDLRQPFAVVRFRSKGNIVSRARARVRMAQRLAAFLDP